MEPYATPQILDARTERSRKIVLVDIENVLDGLHATASTDEIVRRAVQILGVAEARRPSDQIIVGCNPQLAFAAAAAFPGAQIVVGRGQDGADNALIHKFDPDIATDRFTELCIVSGDHAFATIVRAAATRDLTTRVIASQGVSSLLRTSATRSLILPQLDSAEPAAATPPKATAA